VGTEPSNPVGPGVTGQFAARPGVPDLSIDPGLHPLGFTPPDAFLFVPSSYRSDTPVPLMVALHGAGGSAADWNNAAVLSDLEQFGIALLAPSSRYATWQLFDNGDVAFIDAALAWTFRRLNVDLTRLAFGGFSDGASIGLSLGLANGSLFPRLLGFSPGYLASLPPHGQPRIFISHGRQDQVLPFSGTEGIVASLRGRAYEVDFVPFDGGHALPAAVAQQAFAWITTSTAAL